MKVFSENTLFLNFKCNFVKNTCQKNDPIIVKNNTKITSRNLTFGKRSDTMYLTTNYHFCKK